MVWNFDLSQFDLNSSNQVLAGDTLFETPISVIRGKKLSPIVLVIAGLHGSEWPGIYAALTLGRRISPDRLQGTLVVLPLANISAVSQKGRTSYYDSLDVNREFPGDPDGKPSQRLAADIFNHIVKECDYVVDYHSAGTTGHYYPHVICFDKKDEYIEDFNVDLIRYGVNKPGFLLTEAYNFGVSSYAIESGGGLILNHMYVKRIVKATYSFFDAVGLTVKDHPENKKVLKTIKRPEEYHYFNKKMIVTSDAGGMIKWEVELGDHVKKGQLLGTIFQFDFTISEIIANNDGIFIYERDALVLKGESLYHLAVGIEAKQ